MIPKVSLTFMSYIGNPETPNPNANEIPVADLVATHDWSSTSLGPMETWDPTLKSTVVSLLI